MIKWKRSHLIISIMWQPSLAMVHIIRGIKKLAHGYNHTYSYRGFNSTHAEMDVINKLDLHYYKRNRIKLDLYVVRVSKSGNIAESKPCMHCIKTMIKSELNIKNVYYSNSNGEIVKTTLYELYMMDSQYITRGARRHHN